MSLQELLKKRTKPVHVSPTRDEIDHDLASALDLPHRLQLEAEIIARRLKHGKDMYVSYTTVRLIGSNRCTSTA